MCLCPCLYTNVCLCGCANVQLSVSLGLDLDLKQNELLPNLVGCWVNRLLKIMLLNAGNLTILQAQGLNHVPDRLKNSDRPGEKLSVYVCTYTLEGVRMEESRHEPRREKKRCSEITT
ncbi:unnamed protein product [Protopolystoma xenopodis]|uniref:Uncharacterized protein n=1 Tax=Protopolystoma xenopodis TaxID=117903 RepID=A0A3S5A564_9PLAT|nr:unnamed protein product [Protopolystoma xenopodis]